MTVTGSSILSQHRDQKQILLMFTYLLILVVVSAGCVRPNQRSEQSGSDGLSPALQDAASSEDTVSPEEKNETAESEQKEGPLTANQHVVSLGDTLNTIAEQYGISSESLMTANKIKDSNLLLPGRVLLIPTEEKIPVEENNTSEPGEILRGTETEIISDHNLIYGPGAKDFDLAHFLQAYDGYLLDYEEEVEGQILSGAEIVQLVADRHSVNPRLLLAVLEYNAGWLTQKDPQNIKYMMGREQEGREGLYKQLSWGANMLNLGFYGRSEGGITVVLVDEAEVPFPPQISDGTAGVQNYLGARDAVTYQEWLFDAGPDGLAAAYRQLFGDPLLDNEVPLLPDDLQQPSLQLPWESGITWYFTGGPHGGWNSGSAWAALDFVPPDVEYGCFTSDSWVTAVADGVIARSGFGAVVLDLDGDGYAGSGWAITYMHLDNQDRIIEGTRVSTGERLGHPGCEGGVTNGTHLHLARTYNGRWISADGSTPLILDGWISGGLGYEYNGWLKRDGVTKTADVYRTEDNSITAE